MNTKKVLLHKHGVTLNGPRIVHVPFVGGALEFEFETDEVALKVMQSIREYLDIVEVPATQDEVKRMVDIVIGT